MKFATYIILTALPGSSKLDSKVKLNMQINLWC